MIILIPAYEPDQRLVDLVRSIHSAAPTQVVVVVDDGSGPAYDAVFHAVAELDAEVLRYPTNRGKGYALRHGFADIEEHHPRQAVVCADCDGQHTLTDIRRVAQVAEQQPGAVVLGSRLVDAMPPRSRFGNSVTRVLFGLSTGTPLRDTQTGLRAYGPALLPWLQTVPGDRFEYELSLLLEASRLGIPHVEVPIDTIYLEGNRSSHFRTFADSARVYAPLLKFSLSSLAAFGIDAAVLFTMAAVTGNLVASVVTARVVSSVSNFATNHRLVFRGSSRRWSSAAARYFALVAVILAANVTLMHLLVTVAGLPLVAGKLLTEAVLFAASFHAQRRFVFGRRAHAEPVATAELVAAGPVAAPEAVGAR